MTKGRYYDTEASPRNLRAIWDRLHDLADRHDANTTTITQQAATIAALQTQLTTAQQTAQQAAIIAGKAVSQSSTGVPPSGGGGGGSGGGGGNGDAHPNHANLVAQAKADLITAGEDLTGPCGGFKIVRRACQYIAPSDPTVGVLTKPAPTPNNCIIAGIGYAADIIMYPDGIIYDVLFDAGGANTPQWNFKGTTDPGLYRTAP
jgi:hypothetical protein